MMENREKTRMTEDFLRRTYTPIPKVKAEEIIVGMTNLLERYASGAIPQRTILDEMAKTIHRTFDFQYLCIALKDSDGKFRYKISIGLTPEATRALYEITYSDSDLFDEDTYPSTVISDITRFYMAESEPYKPEEASTYSRPSMLGVKRASPDDMLEGDFFNIFIKGARGEILGYVELGTTRNSKLPDRRSIIWLEAISKILAIILTRKAE